MKVVLAAMAVLAVITMSACSGGGTPTPPPPSGPTVTVSPATANVQEGSTQQFTATVANTTATTVNWQVNGVTGGNATVGTISSTGLYTAPDVVPSPASVTVTAVLQADTAVTGNSIVTITKVVFNNSSLKGTYIFSLSGVDLNGFGFYAVGAITADGNGNITAGAEDFNDLSSGYAQATSLSGTYNVTADGRGTLTFTNSISNTPFSFAFALRALNSGALNETDTNVVAGTGSLEQQATGVATPSGNYAYGYSGTGNCGPFNAAGIFALSGAVLGGTQDLNCGGSITKSQSLSGSYGSVGTMGRGTGKFTSAVGSLNFVYYVVSANRYRLLCTNAATFFLGTADLQTQPSFANNNFNGNYVVNISANTSQGGVSYTLIQFNASGGNVSSGHYDVNDTGTVGQASLSGAYSLNSNGRISGSFNVNGASLPFAMYLISPSQAYYVDERTSVIGGGNVYAQASAVTANAAWAGSYATKQFGYFVAGGGILAINATSISGQISADGNGNLAGTLDINDPPPLNIVLNQTLQGTYSVGNVAPGRTTLSITTPQDGTRTFVGYIIDPTRLLLLETDAGLTAGGDAVRQF
jgi:hypothetical protein